MEKGQVVKTIRGRRYLYQRYPFWNKELKRKDDRWRSLGPCDDRGVLLQPATVRVDAVHASMPVGALAVFWAAVQELGVLGRAEAALGDARAARLVAALALNHVTGRRPLDDVSAWINQGPLPEWLGLTADVNRSQLDAAMSALCHREEDGTTRDQGLVLQHAMTKAWRGRSREPAQYYYDVTKVVYNGDACELAEPGYHPRATTRNVVGFGLVTSRTHHHPVVCMPIYGSRNDTITIQDTVHTLQAFGFGKVTLIHDRGMVSQGNVEFLVKNGYHQVGIVPATHKEAWTYLAKYAPHQVEQARHVALRPSGPLYARAWNAKLMGRTMRLVVATDPMRRAREQSHRDELLYEAKETKDPKRLKEVRHGLGSIAVPSPGRRGWTVDEGSAQEDRKADGRFLLFSTDLSLSARDMIALCFQRESIEHCFRTGKGLLGLEPIRYHRLDRVRAHTTLLYLGWLLWSWVERRLREKYPRLSLQEALETLESVHLVRFASKNATHEWTTRLNADQEKLLKHLKALTFLPQTHGG